MDTSKQYIEMCQQAVEIQKLRTVGGDWWEGDFFTTIFDIDKNRGAFIFKRSDQYWTHHPIKHRVESIWLPRQDQLQGMLEETDFPFPLIEEFLLFVWETWESKPTKGSIADRLGIIKFTPAFTSMEQLWLAFVMNEKYNKTWNKEDWQELT